MPFHCIDRLPIRSFETSPNNDSLTLNETPVTAVAHSALEQGTNAPTKKPPVKFSNQVKVVLIPTRKEYKENDLIDALHWNKKDVSDARVSAQEEIRAEISFSWKKRKNLSKKELRTFERKVQQPKETLSLTLKNTQLNEDIQLHMSGSERSCCVIT